MFNKIKGILNPIKDYFKDLPLYGKILLVIIVILCKIGPDFILFPILYKWIKKQHKKKEA